MSYFNLLSLDEVGSSLKNLRCLRTFGRSAMATDLCNLLGGQVTEQGAFYWLRDRKATGIPPSVYYIDDLAAPGIPKAKGCDYSRYCIRPTVSLKDIEGYTTILDGGSDYMEIEYGEFPQTIEVGAQARMLESLFNIGGLNKTGKLYTINDQQKNADMDNRPFTPRSLTEYELSGSRYIRVQSKSLNLAPLSDSSLPKADAYYWVRVEPIRWIVDKFSNTCISKRAIMAGIPFNHTSGYTGYFNDSDIMKYFDFYFTDEIKPLAPKKKAKAKAKAEPKKNLTPYGFSYAACSEDDLIRGAILSDVSVFLHGRSSDGKSARVKAIDPDCEIIYLRNSTPESLNGKSAYNSNTGEMIDIPPTWYKRVMERCEKHPERIHIVFLDEITNALHSIQGMAFNIVLNKEVNGIWRLPDNVRIVAAGNDLEDSMAANTLVEPLFNRFAHVYIKTNAKSWLKWAMEDSTPSYLEYEKDSKPLPKIHPAVIAYIQSRGDSALRTPFTGERPNADPRKWELASRILFKTGKPNMIKSLVGNDITKDFIAFCKENPLSISDVINGKYNIDVIRKYDLAKKSMIVVGLALCDEAYFHQVRAFVKRLEPELVSYFDSLWLQNNPDGVDILAAAVDGE